MLADAQAVHPMPDLLLLRCKRQGGLQPTHPALFLLWGHVPTAVTRIDTVPQVRMCRGLGSWSRLSGGIRRFFDARPEVFKGGNHPFRETVLLVYEGSLVKGAGKTPPQFGFVMRFGDGLEPS